MNSYLFVEEVVCEVVEHHGVGGVYGVGLGEKLHAVLDGILRLVIQLQNCQTDQRTNTVLVQIKRTLKCKSEKEFQFIVTFSQTHA